MPDNERQRDLEHGLRVREQVLGVVTRPSTSNQTAPDLGPLSDEVLWGRIWGRPGLELKIRSLCTVVALVSLERFQYARAHIGGAKRLGITKTEMSEAMMQLTFYVGLPVVHEALRLVAEVYQDD